MKATTTATSSSRHLTRSLDLRLRRMAGRLGYRVRKGLASKWDSRRSRALGEPLFDNSLAADYSRWIFHDERWIRIEKRWPHRGALAAGAPLRIADNPQELTDEVRLSVDGSIRFDGAAETADEWLYLYLDPREFSWVDFRWTFRVKVLAPFRELQFGFRYQDFYNRYRYRFENDSVFFDKVVNGQFQNAFGSAGCALELDRWYEVRIDIVRNNFRLYLDGKLMLNDWDFDKYFKRGSIAIILWEDNGKTSLSAVIDRLRVRQLKPR
jgi:hypothetical protein